jgi:hypothetical protein
MQNEWEKLDEPKKEHPGSVDLLDGKNNVGGMMMTRKQATGTKKVVSKKLTIMTIPNKRAASKQRQFKKIVSILLAICSLF